MLYTYFYLGESPAKLLPIQDDEVGKIESIMFHNQTTRQETGYRTFFDWDAGPDISPT